MSLCDEAWVQQKGLGRIVLGDILFGLRLLWGLGLAALLVVLIVKRGPWRAMAVAGVLLVFTAALPWRVRRWGLVALAAGVVGLIVWIVWPEEQGRWQPYHLEEAFAAYNRAHAVPDEENAAVVYDELGQEWADSAEGAEVEADRRLGDDLFGKWLDVHEKRVIERLREAARRPACFRRLESRSYWHRSPGADFLYSLGRYLPAAIADRIEKGRIGGAIDWVEALIQTADRVRDHSEAWWLTPHLLYGAFKEMNRMLATAPLTEEQILHFEHLAGGLELDWEADWRRSMPLTLLELREILLASLYQCDGEGHVRRSGAVLSSERWECYLISGLVQDLRWDGLTACARKADRLLAWLTIPADPQDTLGRLGGMESLYERVGRGESIQADQRSREWDFDSLLEQWTRATVDWLKHRLRRMEGVQAAREGTLLVAALRRYREERGEWPEGLGVLNGRVPSELLLDPLGYRVQYERVGESFRLYSPGTKTTHWEPPEAEEKEEVLYQGF